MKPWFAFVGLCCALGLLNLPTASGANTNLLVGTWETQLVGPGSDRTTCYLTFSNDFTVGGYGIALKSFGPIVIGGFWGVDSKGRLTGSFTEYRDDGAIGATLTRLSVSRNKIRGSAFSSRGRVTLKGDALSTPLDISGSNWVGEVRTRGNTSFQSYVFTVSTNAPGWYDVTGAGVGPSGAYTISGAVIITSDRRANGYFESDFGNGGTTSTWSFAGKFIPSLECATLRGHSDTGNGVRIRLTNQ
jgi:hypothetical protein